MRPQPLLLAVVIALSTFLVGAITFYVMSHEKDALDKHGIAKLYKSEKAGMNWVSNWKESRRFAGEDLVDPKDPWFTVTENSSFYEASGGLLHISGTPRMYVRDPALRRQWRNVEITMYFKRVADDNTPYAGMVAVSRSNHGATGSPEKDLCDSRGYGGRMRYDGYMDFEKEISHPTNVTSSEKLLWPQGMPHDVWLGYKFVIYDLPGGAVKLELWLDQTNGKNGGTWGRVNEVTDTGVEFGVALKACSPGIDPSAVLDGTGVRAGSESGKPNISTYFRTDNVASGGGLVYKKGSIREITTDRIDE